MLKAVWKFIVDGLLDVSKFLLVHCFVQKNLTSGNDSVKVGGTIH